MSAKRYQLLLVGAYQKCKHYCTQSSMCPIVGKHITISPLALPLLAAMTPEHYDVRIVDEELEPLPLDIRPDLVGISTHTNTIQRCYEIADHFRAMGVPVVLGGPHASFAVEEGLEHADSVVVGEAEGTWPQLLDDFENGCLQPRYESAQQTAYRSAPVPRWDLIDTRKVLAIPVQATRGCPYGCEFCVATKMFGRKMRYREPDDVVREVKASPLKTILFVDDNLTINKAHARELVSKLKGLGISWTCQSSLDIATEEQLLHEMAEAGCEHMIVGFESLNPESLLSIRKYHNRVAEYKEAIDRIHAAGIIVLASFVVGFDCDTLEEFRRIERFAQEASLPYVLLNLLVPTPGTDLRIRLEQEGRWSNPSTEFMEGIFPAMHYMNFSQTELYEEFLATVHRLYSFDAIRSRVLSLFRRGSFRRKRNARDFGFLHRLTVAASIARRHIFSSDRGKRAFFLELFALARRGVVSYDRAVGMLISMEGFNRHLGLLRSYRDTYLPRLAAEDKGPWQAKLGARSA
jgi:radical SAM superfamily enzyme YgiQ (UPF0313 family)